MSKLYTKYEISRDVPVIVDLEMNKSFVNPI